MRAPRPAVPAAPPTIAFCVLDGGGRVIVERNADDVFSAASTIKLAVLAATLAAADAGALPLATELVCHRRMRNLDDRWFAPGDDDTDPEFPDGERATVAALMSAMIVRSSNEATNTLVDALGAVRISASITACGAERTRFERMLGDRGAILARHDNVSTPRDLALILHALTTGRVVSGPSARTAQQLLAMQEHIRIGWEVPAGIPWGSKSGDVPGVEHDVAYVGDVELPSARFLAVCTAGFAPEEGRAAIRGVAAALLSGSICVKH